jgi:hypothetical protein
MISGLQPATLYTVVVEARKLQAYSALQEGKNYRRTPFYRKVRTTDVLRSSGR